MSEGGLHVPNEAQEEPNKGMVVDVGMGVFGIPSVTVRVADDVYYGKYVGEKIGGYLFIKHEDVIAFEKGEAWNENKETEQERALQASR